MVINYFGDGCFRLQSGEISLLADPVNNRLKGDVVLKTLAAVDCLPSGNEISFPGEYEIKEIAVHGWPAADSMEKSLKTVYSVNWEDMRFVFLGHLSKPITDEDLLEELAEADILFIPSGEKFLKMEEAARLVKKLEPAVVIPTFSKNPQDFSRALGQKSEILEKFVFKKKDLTDLEGKVLVLKPAG